MAQGLGWFDFEKVYILKEFDQVNDIFTSFIRIQTKALSYERLL